jgi:hypothetical protein
MDDVLLPFPPDDGGAERAAIARVQDMAAALLRTLQMARLLLESGRAIELEGLQSAIGQLCARALDLPPAGGRQVRALLQALLGEHDLLEAALHRAAPAD